MEADLATLEIGYVHMCTIFVFSINRKNSQALFTTCTNLEIVKPQLISVEVGLLVFVWLHLSSGKCCEQRIWGQRVDIVTFVRTTDERQSWPGKKIKGLEREARPSLFLNVRIWRQTFVKISFSHRAIELVRTFTVKSEWGSSSKFYDKLAKLRAG